MSPTSRATTSPKHSLSQKKRTHRAPSRPTHKILIIEDERDVIDLLTLNLTRAGGFVISTAMDGATGLQMARDDPPALILLDLMLPEMPGLEICKILKIESSTRHIPIIMLSAKAEEIDRILGLELGADDYVTKPFSPRELILRIRAVLSRRNTQSEDEIISVGDIRLDATRNEVSVGGKPVSLTALEFKLLARLMRGRGRVQQRESLLHEVWGYESAMDTRTVDTHVRRLRKKLGKASDAIVTVRGFGYRIQSYDRK